MESSVRRARLSVGVAFDQFRFGTRYHAHQHHLASPPWPKRVARSLSRSGVSGTTVSSVVAVGGFVTQGSSHENPPDSVRVRRPGRRAPLGTGPPRRTSAPPSTLRPRPRLPARRRRGKSCPPPM